MKTETFPPTAETTLPTAETTLTAEDIVYFDGLIAEMDAADEADAEAERLAAVHGWTRP